MLKTIKKAYKQAKPSAKDVGYDRLDFLRKIIGAEQLTLNEVARECGVSSTAMSSSFITGDMRLSFIRKIADRCGYELEFYLTRDKNEVEYPEKRMMPGEVTVYSEKIISNLAFLLVALKRYEISISKFSQLVPCAPTTIYSWLNNDDMYISRLYQLAYFLDMYLVIDLKKIPPADYGLTPKIVTRINYRSNIDY